MVPTQAVLLAMLQYLSSENYSVFLLMKHTNKIEHVEISLAS